MSNYTGYGGNTLIFRLTDLESPEAWKDEWDTIEKMESSSAIISSSIGCRLAVRWILQLYLSIAYSNINALVFIMYYLGGGCSIVSVDREALSDSSHQKRLYIIQIYCIFKTSILDCHCYNYLKRFYLSFSHNFLL